MPTICQKKVFCCSEILCFLSVKSRKISYFASFAKGSKDKKLSHSSMEAFFRRPPGCYNLLFDLDSPMTDEERQKGIITMFDEFICRFAQNSLSISGICDLANRNELILTTSVKEEFDKLIQ